MKHFAKLALLGLVLSACTTTPTSDTDADPIQIGFIGPLTGEASAYGIDPLNAVQLAVDERNAAGGIDGREVVVVAEDGRCTGADAVSAAQKLVNVDQVVGIIGGQCSGETLAAAPIVESAGVVLISPVSSSPDVTDAGEFVFRNYPSDALKSIAMATYFAEQGHERVAIISENTDFAQAFRNALKEELGEEAVVFDEMVEPGTKDFRTLMARLQNEEFDVFFPNAQSPASMAAMMQQLREQGLTQPAISHDVADTTELIEVGGEAVADMYAINVPASGAGTNFEDDFVSKYDEPKAGIAFAAHAYDAANLLMEAIAEVGTDGEALRQYLNALEGYDGVVGTFHFDENGDVVGVPYVLRQVQDGQWVTVSDIEMDMQ